MEDLLFIKSNDIMKKVNYKIRVRNAVDRKSCLVETPLMSQSRFILMSDSLELAAFGTGVQVKTLKVYKNSQG